VMYEKGRGVAQDYALARRWYTQLTREPENLRDR
jgi:TPR repeat protein